MIYVDILYCGLIIVNVLGMIIKLFEFFLYENLFLYFVFGIFLKLVKLYVWIIVLFLLIDWFRDYLINYVFWWRGDISKNIIICYKIKIMKGIK